MLPLASRPRRPQPPARHLQRGAVLYVALIMLILLALIGIVGLQVTTLQERMAANYGSSNAAFQAAESGARQQEANIQRVIASGGSFSADSEDCPLTGQFDPLAWADTQAAATASTTRRIDRCFAQSSLTVGRKQNEETGNIYQVTALASDDPGNPTSSSVVDTIFIP